MEENSPSAENLEPQIAEPKTATELQNGNKKPIFNIMEVVLFFRDLTIIIIIVLIIRSYFMAPFQINGSSMENSYHNGEYILVDKFSYANFGLFTVGNPNRGDVVILMPHAENNKTYYIKRVIGLPGDTLRFDNGDVYVKPAGWSVEIKLNEDYLSAVNKGKTYLPFDVKTSVFTVPADSYFVMGDNRNNSSDSRACFESCSFPNSGHYVTRNNIVGKLWVDFGYFQLPWTDPNNKTLHLVYPPRWLDSPREWTYPELVPNK